MTKEDILAFLPSRRKSASATTDVDRDTSHVTLITGEPPPSAQAGGVDLSAIASKVAAGQERLAMELVASGKGRAEIFEALYEDLKTQKADAEAKKPEVSAKEVAAVVLAELRAGTPAVPSTSEGSEPNAYEQYKAIEDPVKRQAFYDEHKEEILKHQPQKKEGK